MKINASAISIIFFIIIHALADLLMTSVSMSNTIIQQTSNYTFQIMRYGTSSLIPANTIVQITFPNAYASTSVLGCQAVGWIGNPTLSCTYSLLNLNVSGGFPTASDTQNFGLQAIGITNPLAANNYSSFTVQLIFPNGSIQSGIGGYSVTITTASATCTSSLITGSVFAQGILNIKYTSNFINSSSVGYIMKLSMLSYYPSDPTQTDISPSLSISNTMLAQYLFQFQFINTFNLTMMMPPSTQPVNNFIFIMTSNAFGNYDNCYISITGVQPNSFTTLTLSQAQVQTFSNIQVSLLPHTPILQTDLIYINFTNTTFNLSQVTNYASFMKGVVGQKPMSKVGLILTISNISSYVIVSELGFVLNSIGLPFSSKPQTFSIYTSTQNGYIRDYSTFTYSSLPGTLVNSSFICLNTQIGYSTSCNLTIQLTSQIMGNSYIKIDFPSGFQIPNAFSQCVTSGPGLNSMSNCNSYALTNSIQIIGLAAENAQILGGSVIQATIPNLNMPTNPGNFYILISTRTQDKYLIDNVTVVLKTIERVLSGSQISITSSSFVTKSMTNYTINLAFPLNLGIPYIFHIYIPYTNVSVPSVNNNLLPSLYDQTTNILTIQNVGTSALTISGFVTYQSTAPITLYGNLSYNGAIYFYFTGYDISMTTPRQINVFSMHQSNNIVGQQFFADLIISELAVDDIISIPSNYYSIVQTDCTPNVICKPGGFVQVKIINNYGTSLTQFTINLINNGYVSVSSFSLVVYDSSGIFMKQTIIASIQTQVTNVLSVTGSQSNPYYLENSTYSFDVILKTTPPSVSQANYLIVNIPATYSIQSWSCQFGCTAPQTPPTNNAIYFLISSTNVKFSLNLFNPVSFLSSIQLTSSSTVGDMDYGQYLPFSPCSKPCRSCDPSDSSICLTCYLWSSQNKIRNGTCVSECQSGQYYSNSSASCQSCNAACASCVNSSTNCYSCNPNFYYFQMACLSQCPSRYYEASTGECDNCQSNCLDCNSTTICFKCNNETYLYKQSCYPSCEPGTYVSPTSNECLSCNANCAICDATGCLECQNQYYIFNKVCYLICPSGLFKATNSCQPCQNPCATCSIFSNNCTSCQVTYNSVNYYYLNNFCYSNSCPSTYYVSPLNNTCLRCLSPCLTCNLTQCLTCQLGLYFYMGYCTQVCQKGTYPTANFTCIQCPLTCSACQSDISCSSCISPYLLYNSTCNLACPDGYFNQESICIPCLNPCLTCSSATVCLSCVSLSMFNGTCMLSCPNGYYPNSTTVLGFNSSMCVRCVLPCVTCVTSTSCLSCSVGLTLYNNSCASSCPLSYYNSNGICFACSLPCLTCNATGCRSCSNSSYYLQGQNCVLNCSRLHPNNVTMVCEACKSPCSTCTWSNSCLSCISPYIYYNGECIQTCPAGKYNNSQLCLDCPMFCGTCYLSSDQINCPSCVANAYYYGYTCVGTCPNNTYLKEPFCLSSSCSQLPNCSTCSNLRCLQCATNFTLNVSSNTCVPVPTAGSMITAVSQIPVPFPFLIAIVLIIVSGFLIKIQFKKMYTPLFMYAFAGIAQCGLFALWLALIYIRGINIYQTGNILKIAATALVGVYFGFNVLGFLLYIYITRKDRKFIVWEKQDNKVASIIVTIIAFIFSFRFIMLKYSKLGELHHFSATLSHDSKLSHQNILAYFSILLISIPAIIISAWIAYLQKSLNYLFFTSIEVSVVSVIMIILSIIQSLSPKNYTLEKKQQFRQGQDADHLQGQSLQQLMVKMGIIEQEYNQCKQIASQEGAVGKKNELTSQISDFEQNRPTNEINYTKGEDEKLQIQSNIHSHFGSEVQSQQFPQTSEDTQELSNRNYALKQAKEQREDLHNILMLAQLSAQSLNRPTRPAGRIKKQNPIRSMQQLQDLCESSEGIESDDEPPPINSMPLVGEKDQTFKVRKQEQKTLSELKNRLEMEERRLGMRRLQQLFDQLKAQQKQQQKLRGKLEKVTEQQKKLKQKEYEKARELIQRNQMSIEDKLSKIQQITLTRNRNQRLRKDKIKSMQKKRKQEKTALNAKKAKKRSLVYPITEQRSESGVDNNTLQNELLEKSKYEEYREERKQSKKLNKQALNSEEEYQQTNIQKQNNQRRIKEKNRMRYEKNNEEDKLDEFSEQLPQQNQSQNNHISWNGEIEVNFKQNNEWKIKSQRASIEKQSNRQNQTARGHNNRKKIMNQDERSSELSHWPIDPQMQQKIKEIQQRAQMYLKQTPKHSTQKTEKLEVNNEFESDVGTGVDIIFYQQTQDNTISGNQPPRRQQSYLQIKGGKKIPKKRVNRNVINLAPSR